MPFDLQRIELPEADPRWNMPYVPAIKVSGGAVVYLSGVTAAPVYHSHPHISGEFDEIPSDARGQAQLAFDNLERVLAHAGGALADIVQLTQYVVDIRENLASIASVAHSRLPRLPATTTVEIARVATDPRLLLEVSGIAVIPG
jgi:enamine deaminase RidA (YjgF/YER057c/UK114 family)